MLATVPVRLGEADCEISFGPAKDKNNAEPLFHDYLVPISSREYIWDFPRLNKKRRLEGFPLLHLDCYASARIHRLARMDCRT